MREWWSKLRGTFFALSGFALSGGRADDLPDEVEANLQIAIAELITDGYTPDEARARALRRFGNVTLTVENAREAWKFPWFDALLQDMRYGFRGIARSRASSAVIVLTLALGIGATTAIFSVVEQVLLKPMPYPFADRLVQLNEATAKIESFSVSWVNYLDWRRDNHSFEEMAAHTWAHHTLTGHGAALFTGGGVVTHTLFPLLGARPVLGRFFNEADDRLGATPTVVLTYEFWQKQFGGNENAVGSAMNLDGKANRIIGVTAPGFKFSGSSTDYYLPLGLLSGDTVDRSKHGSIQVLGRLKENVTMAAAIADLDNVMKRLAVIDPGPESDHRAHGEMLGEDRKSEFGPPLYTLLGAAILVLAIACANVASLILARSTARARELAIRAAIGAGAMRLTRQLLTENFLVSAIGGLGGLALASLGLQALVNGAPSSLPTLEAKLDWPVLAFTAAITLLTGLFVGLAPTFVTRGLDLVSSLNAGGRSATSAKRGHYSRNALVIAEIAITLVLAFGSGLLLRSLLKAETADPGFAPDHVLETEIVLPESTYPSGLHQQSFYERLMNDARALPGVTDVGAVCSAPASGECGDWFYSVLGKPVPPKGNVPVSYFNEAEPGYFHAMRIRLLAGREFTGADREGGLPVAIVNEAFAKQWWPNESAIGQRIKNGGPYMKGNVFEVVGVVGNFGQDGLDLKPEVEIYLPVSQSPSAAMTILIRTTGDPVSLAPAIRRKVAELDPNLAIQRIRPFLQVVESTLARRRFIAVLLTLFAGLAMLLAAVGIYGLLNYWVSVREDEIAIRMALGAERSKILRWVGVQAIRLAVIGVAIGAVAGAFASRWLESLLYGVSALNPSAIAAAAVTVLVVVLAAAALPAWRATRVDAVSRLNHT